MKQKTRKVVYLDSQREHYNWSDIVNLLDQAVEATTLTQKELWDSFRIEDDDYEYIIITTNENQSIGEDLTPMRTIIQRQAMDELESLDERGHIEFVFRYRRKDGELK